MEGWCQTMEREAEENELPEESEFGRRSYRIGNKDKQSFLILNCVCILFF